VRLFLLICAALASVALAIVILARPAHASSCPPTGDSPQQRLQQLDTLKNWEPGHPVTNIQLAQ
jgi:hypothetical protein